MSVNSKMKAIADAIRAKTGGTASLTLDAMATEIAGISGGGGFPNGAEWTQSNVTAGAFVTVVYHDGLWVASGCYSTGCKDGLYYSTDGMTWTKSNIDKSCKAIVNVDGVWVAGDSTENFNGSGLWYSTDGMTWTQSNVTSGAFCSLHYACGLCVAGGYQSGTAIYYSTDGMTWTKGTGQTGSANVGCIQYADGVWLADGKFYSTDGMAWTQVSDVRKYVSHANGLWVGGSIFASGSGLYYSTDGMTWTQSNVTSGYFGKPCRANGLWVVGSFDGGSSNNYGLYYSTDGMTWTRSNVTSGMFSEVWNACGMWVAGAFYSSNNYKRGLYYSTDGMTWTQSNVTSGYFGKPCNANGIWVIGSSQSGKSGLYYSKTWQPS